MKKITILFYCLLHSYIIHSQIITTYVGNGAAGFSGDNGPATNAMLNFPENVRVDPSGNLFIADRYNFRIRKVNASGTITTIGGGGSMFLNGASATNSYIRPYDIALDVNGDVYIAEGERISKINTAGIITRIAGNGSSGVSSGDNGLAINCSFTNAENIAVDAIGNIYMTDGNRIRKIDTSGIITTIAGNGTTGCSITGLAINQPLSLPSGIAVDDNGNVFFSSRGCNRVYKIDTSGYLSSIAGTGAPWPQAMPIGDGGPAVNAFLKYPEGLTVDNFGNIYVADTESQRIRKIDTAGIITTVAGAHGAGFYGDNGPSGNYQSLLSYPRGVSVSNSGDIFIADSGNNRVRKITASQSITFIPLLTKTYGDAPFSLNATTTSGLPITYTSSDPSIAAISGNMVTIVGAGNCTITASQGGNGSYYPASPVHQTLIVNKASQLITFSTTPTKTYGDPNFALTATASSGLQVVFASSNPAVASVVGNIITINGAGVTNITASQIGNSYYNPAANVSHNFEVNKANLNVTANSQSRNYGSTNPDLSITFQGFVKSENSNVLDIPPNVSTSATITSDVGVYSIIPSGGSDNNYSYTFINGSLEIIKASLSLISNASKIYGSTNPTLNIEYSGFKNNETPSVIDTPPSISSSVTQSTNAGTYSINLSGGADNNYSFNLNTGSFVVNKANLTATALSASKIQGQANPAFQVSYSGFVNGETASVIDIQASVSTSATTSSPVGSYTLTPYGASDNNYSFNYINGVLSINAPPACSASISKSGNLCLDGRLRLTVSVTGGTPVSYSWSTGETSNRIFVYWGGTYEVTVTFSSGCTATSSIFIENATGSNCIFYLKAAEETVNPTEALAVFPNPADQELTVSLEVPADGTTLVKLLDYSGRVLVSESIQKGRLKTTIPTSDIPSGLYLVAIISKESKKYLKAIIRH